MGKLVFRYGAMNAAKSASVCMMAHNYRSKDLSVLVLKTTMPSRWGEAADAVHSRTNLSVTADVVIDASTDVFAHLYNDLVPQSKYHCLLVDECQFLTATQVEALRTLAQHVNIYCYGLRTHFLSRAFEGSMRLLELADTIEEIKTPCSHCPRKAIINAKFRDVNGKRMYVKTGNDIIDIGAEDKYAALCWTCFLSQTREDDL